MVLYVGANEGFLEPPPINHDPSFPVYIHSNGSQKLYNTILSSCCFRTRVCCRVFDFLFKSKLRVSYDLLLSSIGCVENNGALSAPALQDF